MFQQRLHRIAPFLGAVVLSLATQAAVAAPINYTILGTAGAGSTVSLGSGSVDVSGLAYTITGFTMSDTNVGTYASTATVGQFDTVASFDFGGGLVFTSDSSSDIYWIQNCSTSTSMSCAGLLNNTASQGVFTYFPAFAVPDVKAGQAFAGFTPDSNYSNGFSGATNLAGYSMTLAMGGSGSVSYIEAVAASQVPEPTTLLLAGLALFGLSITKRRPD